MQEEPAAALSPETLGLLAAIGIEKGKPFAPDARMKRILTEAAAVANATARALVFRSRITEAYFFPNSAWCTPFIGGSHEFLSQPGVRNLDARSFFFYYATGVTPAMAMKMVGVGSQYAVAFVDSEGRPFDGSRTYKVHLPPGIPANPTGSRPCPARDGMPFCASTVRSSRGSTRPGSPAKSSG